jgi:carboxyl-terminal processing protease
LPYDEIKKQNYTPAGNLSGKIPVLLQNHQKRMMQNAEYKYLLEDINDIKKSRSKVYTTLNKELYLNELNAAEDNKKRREEARKKLKEQTKEDADLILDEAREVLLDLMKL